MWRKLDPGRQALLVLVHLRKGESFAEVGAGFGVSTTTCWRYVNETVELLARRAPKLRAALRAAKRRGHAYVTVDGTPIPIDRIAADRPLYSGKHKIHGMNLHVVASPDGDILWVSGDLPGSTHDTATARVWTILAALRQAGLIARQGLPRLRPHRPARDHPLQGPEQARVPEGRQPRPRTPARTGRTRPRPTQNLAHPAQTPLLPTPGRANRQSYPRPPELRDHNRVKKAGVPRSFRKAAKQRSRPLTFERGMRGALPVACGIRVRSVAAVNCSGVRYSGQCLVGRVRGSGIGCGERARF